MTFQVLSGRPSKPICHNSCIMTTFSLYNSLELQFTYFIVPQREVSLAASATIRVNKIIIIITIILIIVIESHKTVICH